jgi:hypothetical protein
MPSVSDSFAAPRRGYSDSRSILRSFLHCGNAPLTGLACRFAQQADGIEGLGQKSDAFR